MFIEQIENLCKEKKIKQTELLRNIGLEKSNATRWKKGGMPSVEVLIKLSNYFNVSIDYLLTGKREIALKEDEKKLLSLYSSLNDKRKGKAELFIEQLAEEQQEEESKVKEVG